jgi:two-component system, LytTR family, response regulator
MSALPEEMIAPRLTFRCGRRTFLIGADELVRISGEGNYSRIHIRSGKTFLVRDSITSLEGRLENYRICRVHRSHLLRLDEIVEVRRTTRYSTTILLADGTVVPLADAYRQNLTTLLDIA